MNQSFRSEQAELAIQYNQQLVDLVGSGRMTTFPQLGNLAAGHMDHPQVLRHPKLGAQAEVEAVAVAAVEAEVDRMLVAEADGPLFQEQR